MARKQKSSSCNFFCFIVLIICQYTNLSIAQNKTIYVGSTYSVGGLFDFNQQINIVAGICHKRQLSAHIQSGYNFNRNNIDFVTSGLGVKVRFLKSNCFVSPIVLTDLNFGYKYKKDNAYVSKTGQIFSSYNPVYNATRFQKMTYTFIFELGADLLLKSFELHLAAGVGKSSLDLMGPDYKSGILVASCGLVYHFSKSASE